MTFPISEHDARRALTRNLGRYQEKTTTRILVLGDGRGGAASNVTAPGGRGYVWARENSNANARYFPILNLGSVQPAADLRVMVGYDPLSQYPNEEQILGSYTTDTIGIGARVTHNTTTSTANNAWRLLSFNTERYDSGSMHSTAAKTSRLTATAPGIYIVSLSVSFAFNATGDRLVSIQRNSDENINSGSAIARDGRQAIATANTNTAITIETQAKFDIGDYVESFVFQNSGASNILILSSDEFSPEFSMVRIEQNLV